MFLASILSLWDTELTIATLLVSFNEYYFFISLILLCLPIKKDFLILQKNIAILSFFINIWTLYPTWLNTTNNDSLNSDKNDRASYLVYYSNVNASNNHKDVIWNQVREHKPDIILLVEFNKDWAESFGDLNREYPYSKMILHKGNFGLAVFSKFQLEKEYVFFERENNIPGLFIDAKLRNEKSIRLGLLHAFPPIGSEAILLRDQYLNTAANLIRTEENQRWLVCGDFNAVAWSSIFKDFLSTSKLDNQMKGIFLGTWPTALYPLQIKIDHCVTRKMQIDTYKVIKESSSDHRPIIFEVKI